ncbi:MAG: hypothetical protein PHP86_15345 [Nevskiales bacterium]|nr:hypothetical protein [Nevskiales bacterium]
MLAIWYLAVPVATRLTDPTPARLLGAELPRDIAREWARWCRHPDFIVDARGRALRAGFERYRGRMRLIAIADDAFYAPPDAVAALARMYTHADVELDTISPADAGVESIGHFGFFRSAMPRRLWQSSADWLVEALPGNRREAA